MWKHQALIYKWHLCSIKIFSKTQSRTTSDMESNGNESISLRGPVHSSWSSAEAPIDSSTLPTPTSASHTMIVYTSSSFVPRQGAGVGAAYKTVSQGHENVPQACMKEFQKRALRIDIRQDYISTLEQVQLSSVVHGLGIARMVASTEPGAFEKAVNFCDCSNVLNKIGRALALTKLCMGNKPKSLDRFLWRVCKSSNKLRKKGVEVNFKLVPIGEKIRTGEREKLSLRTYRLLTFA